MGVPIPDLSGWSFDDLLREMIGSIPKYNRYWTNFNPSDPGVAILEMLAWIAQTLIYRAEEMPEEVYRKFLQLAAGPGHFRGWPDDSAFQRFSAWRRLYAEQGPDLETLKGETQRFLNSRYRAITLEDFRNLALEASPRVKRVEVRQTSEDEVELILAAKGTVHPKPTGPSAALADAKLREDVLNYLKARRLLGTPIRVGLAVYTRVKLRITLIGWKSGALQPGNLKRLVKKRLRLYLDSFRGGPEGKGWPYGRDLTEFDLYHALEKVDGVKHVREVAGWDETARCWRPFNELNLKIDGLIDLRRLEIIIEKDEE